MLENARNLEVEEEEEPDVRGYSVEKDFEENGCRCVVIGGFRGFRCAYVGVPKESPYYGADSPDDLPQEVVNSVHGGVTYVNQDDGYPVDVDKDIWWLGMDFAHCADDGIDQALLDKFLKEEGQQDFFRRMGMIPDLPADGHAWTADEAAEECKKLARLVN